jgi:hypothetical protein
MTVKKLVTEFKVISGYSDDLTQTLNALQSELDETVGELIKIEGQSSPHTGTTVLTLRITRQKEITI